MHWHSIDSREGLEKALGRETSEGEFNLILKHSTRCALSSMAKNRLERKPLQALNYYILDVIANRSVSNALAEMTDIRHESPQCFVFHDGNLIYQDSHMGIDPEEIQEAILAKE
jgi:bacillithiol system protein YtxJ